MNTKQKLFTVAVSGAIMALALLIQAVNKFGFIVLLPFAIGHVSGLIFNYLRYEWRVYDSKQARYSKATYGGHGTESGQRKDCRYQKSLQLLKQAYIERCRRYKNEQTKS